MKRLLCAYLIFSNCLVFSQAACNYTYSRLIRIDHTKVAGGASLTNFPVLITTLGLADQSLFKSVSNGGHVQNNNGYDIYFTAADGVTPINFQLEYYIATTGEFDVWVNVPAVSATVDTYIYMYYGNAAANTQPSSPIAWNANYVGVWHMDEDPGGTAPQYLDATSINPENGTTFNMTSSNKVLGLISNACYFDGNSDYITFSVNSLPANSAAQTISAWVNFAGTNSGNQNFVVMENGGAGSGQQLGFRGNTLLEWEWGGGTLVAAPSVPSAGAWHYCVYTYDGISVNSIFVDGVLTATSTTAPQTGVPTILAMGCYMSNPTSPGGEYYQGTLDEVHVLTSVLSPGWIGTEYNNQSSPATFCFISPEANVWVGSASSNWNTSNNWSGSVVPASGANVIIASGATNQPTVTGNTQVGYIWVQPGATVTIGPAVTLSVYNDVINCGTIASNATGTLALNSNSATTPQNQNISGTGVYALSNLTINNTFATSPTVTLNTPVPISVALNLTSGLLNTTAANILIMQNGSSAPALTSAATSYVNGPMKYQKSTSGSSSLNFPVGKSLDCRPFVLTINHATTNLYNYTSEVFNANPWATFGSVAPGDMPVATVDTISGVHYWKVDRTDNAEASQPSLDLSGNQIINLYFGTNDGVYEGSALTIVKNTSATPQTWIDIGGSSALGNFSTPQAGNITSTSSPTAFNSFSAFTLGSKKTGWNPLPIELVSFSAVPDGEKIDIKWETATETNNAYFTIEKSKDAVNFTKLIDMPGAGNSATYKDYAETDYQPYTGVSYYRLKQTDFNGNFKYFNIVTVNLTVQQNITVYPSPIDNTTDLNVKLSGYQNQPITVFLRDVDGKEFLSSVLLSTENNQIFIVDKTKSLAPGTYIVTAASNDKIYNYKLIVK